MFVQYIINVVVNNVSRITILRQGIFQIKQTKLNVYNGEIS